MTICFMRIKVTGINVFVDSSLSPSALTHIEEEPLVVHTTVGTIAAGMAVK